MQQPRSISENDVYTFISVAPPHILKRMQEKIAEKLNENSESDFRRGVMMAHLHNTAPPPPPTPVGNQTSTATHEEAGQSAYVSIRDKLMQMSRNIDQEGVVGGPAGLSGISDGSTFLSVPSGSFTAPPGVANDLMAQFNAMPKHETSEDWKDIPAEFLYINTDNYGDGLVKISDPELVKRLESKMQECKANNLYFPYGMKGDGTLKIKKFRRTQGERCRATLSFSRWERDGKGGFSCYAK